jgi:uncharacterized protein
VFLYLAVGVLLNTPLYDFCVLAPSKKIDTARFDAVHGAEKKKFSIPAFESQIQAWLFSVEGAKHVAIVHHGRGGNLYNKVFLAQHLINLGMSVLVYDYRGYGESTGVARLKNFVPDGLLVHDFATNKLGYSPSRVVIVGESIGTGPACEIARQRTCAAIFLQSPFTSLPQEAKDSFPILHIYPDWCFPNPKFENIEYVKTAHPPLLIIHGAVDKQIPASHFQKLGEVAADPKQLILLPHAGHRNVGGEDAAMYTEGLTNFFSKYLRGKAEPQSSR